MSHPAFPRRIRTEKESFTVQLEHRIKNGEGDLGKWAVVDSSTDPMWVQAMTMAISQGDLGDDYSQYRLVEVRTRVLAGRQD